MRTEEEKAVDKAANEVRQAEWNLESNGNESKEVLTQESKNGRQDTQKKVVKGKNVGKSTIRR
jgi:hypothetical protein